MNDNKNVPRSDYSVDEILAEAKVMREHSPQATLAPQAVPAPPATLAPQAASAPQETLTSQTAPAPPEKKAEAGAEKRARKRPAVLGADEIAHEAQKALRMEAGEPMPDGGAPKPPEKKKRLFRRRKKEKEEPLPDDIYYGLQLKSLEEYRKEYEQTVLLDPLPLGTEEKERRERHERLEKIMNRAGLDAEEMLGSEDFAQEEKSAPGPAEETEAGGAGGQEQAGARPVPPRYPPKQPVRNPEQPPVPPSVEPGPAMEPEIRPPIVEPPLAPAVGESGGEEARSPRLEAEAPQTVSVPQTVPVPQIMSASQTAAVPTGTDRPFSGSSPLDRPEALKCPTTPTAIGPEGPTEKRHPLRAGDALSEFSKELPTPGRDRAGTAPPPIREPVVPPRVKDGVPAAPPRKEPSERPAPQVTFAPQTTLIRQTASAPQYRAGGLPVQVIELAEFDAVLAAEASSYPEPAPKIPEPIPFPQAEAAPEVAPGKGDGEETGPAEEEAASRREPPRTLPPDKASPVPLNPSAGPGSGGTPPKKRFRLFGSDEESNEPSEEPGESEAELDDYSGPADAPSVMSDLSSNVRGLLLRFAVTAICCALTLALSILREYSGIVPAGLHKLFETPTYPILELFFLLLACAFCAPAFWNGLRGLFTFQANADSAASVAAVAAACQNVAYLIFGPAGGVPLYSSLAAAALFLNTAGKLSMARRILRNFRFLSSPEQKYAVQLFDDHNTALLLAKNSAIGEPRIAYQSKAPFLRNFLRDSYAPDPSDHISQLTAPAGFLASLGLCIVTAVLTKNAGTALAAFAASACVCVPFANMLSVNLPLARLSRIGAQVGGMAVGWPAVEQFCQTNAVMLGAGDLFPRGTVILSGIQTFAGERIDEAILDATALTAAAGGPLNDLFSQIVKNRGDFLPHVQRPSYEDGMGISGAVEDRVILVGNRELMQKHGIDAPSHDYEEKYIRAGKHPLYLASAGTLVAMFLVSYRSDRRRAVELRRMENNGIALIVRTRDPQVTPELVAECFGLSRNSVSILPERLGEVYDGLVTRTGGRPEAVLATKGRAVGMLRLLTACVRQRSNISIAAALQVAGAALGFALVAFFAAYAGLAQLSVTSLAIFEAFWAASVVFVPRIRKP